MRVILLESVDSTNRYLKDLIPSGEDTIVCAEMQTGGQGTKGRTFLSERGGVYLSALNFYDELPARDAFRIMMHAAVSVCRTAEAFGVFPEIKWPNDILVGGRKLCGILIENTFSGEFVLYSVVGMGINVSNDVSSLGGIAVSEAAGCPIDPASVRDTLISMLARESSPSDYRARIKFLGKEIRILADGREESAVARAILDDGRLEVETQSGVRVLSSEEISVRFIP